MQSGVYLLTRFYCRFAAVQRKDIVDEGLARLVKGYGFGGIGMPIFGRGSLANFELLAGCCSGAHVAKLH
jgi:hypothetical protein